MDIKLGDFLDFCSFREILYTRKISKPQNREIKYQQDEIPAGLQILFFSNIFPKHDIDTRISHISRNNNEIRVSITYLLTITLINKRKIPIVKLSTREI